MELTKDEVRFLKSLEKDAKWEKFIYILFGGTLIGNTVLFVVGVIKKTDYSLLCLVACWILFSILMMQVFYVKFRLFKIARNLMNQQGIKLG